MKQKVLTFWAVVNYDSTLEYISPSRKNAEFGLYLAKNFPHKESHLEKFEIPVYGDSDIFVIAFENVLKGDKPVFTLYSDLQAVKNADFYDLGGDAFLNRIYYYIKYSDIFYLTRKIERSSSTPEIDFSYQGKIIINK